MGHAFDDADETSHSCIRDLRPLVNSETLNTWIRDSFEIGPKAIFKTVLNKHTLFDVMFKGPFSR